MLTSILTAYGFDAGNCTVQAFGTGLINHTWLVKNAGEEYILQKINTNVFRDPFSISHNLQTIGNYLRHKFPGYLFVAPLPSLQNNDIVIDGKEYYRLFPFVKNTVTYTTLKDPQQAYEAAKQFGKFTNLLSGLDSAVLKETLPDFHNLTLRYSQFKDSLANGNKERIAAAAGTIKQIENYSDIVEEFEKIKNHKDFKKRVMHHDTKISNVLFDTKNNGICIIDLDTVMPGYFISDVGDMMRTYLSPAGEEEKDYTKIEIRDDFFDAIVTGYLSEMKAELTEAETNYFVYAGKFMIFMQAVRFLTDYLKNDIYYGAKYEEHNFIRAKNQLHLLDRLQEKEQQLLQRTKQQ